MKSSVTDSITALATAAMAALGGAFAVFAEFDDSPGGVLLGLLLVVGAMALGVRNAQRRR